MTKILLWRQNFLEMTGMQVVCGEGLFVSKEENY